MRQAGWLLMASLMVSVPSSTRSDDAPKVDPKAEAVDRVLGEWHARASKIKSIEAKFRLTDNSKANPVCSYPKYPDRPPDRSTQEPKTWPVHSSGDRSKSFEGAKSSGRAILVAPNLGMIESAEIDETGKLGAINHRVTWTEQHCLNFQTETRTVFRYIRPDAKTPPADLSLPFLFGMSVQCAKAEHDWEILKEDDSIVILQATRRKNPKVWIDPHVKRFIIELDKRTYQPRKVTVGGKSTPDRAVYEVIDLRINAEVDLHELKDPCLDAWRIMDSWSF